MELYNWKNLTPFLLIIYFYLPIFFMFSFLINLHIFLYIWHFLMYFKYLFDIVDVGECIVPEYVFKKLQ